MAKKPVGKKKVAEKKKPAEGETAKVAEEEAAPKARPLNRAAPVEVGAIRSKKQPITEKAESRDEAYEIALKHGLKPDLLTHEEMTRTHYNFLCEEPETGYRAGYEIPRAHPERLGQG